MLGTPDTGVITRSVCLTPLVRYEHMFDTEATTDARLDHLPPGPALAQLLGAVDLDTISGKDRVVVMRAHQRMASHYTARVYDDMAAVSDAIHDLDDDPRLAHESAAAEIRAALRLTRRSADTELELALNLRRRLPAVHRLLHEGRLDGRRARVIAAATSHRSVGDAQTVVAAIIDDAPDLTTGQLTSRLRQLCIDTDPDEARDRYHHATEQRRIVCEPTVDGTAHLLALDLPPDRVQAVTDRINRLARELRNDRETRTMDQLRADVFLDLLTGTSTSRGGSVDIRVDLDTLAGLSEMSGDLAGYGPVIADIARQVTAASDEAEWRYTATDPLTGTRRTGITRRRPTAHQQRRVESQNTTCIFPGCRMPAVDCDLDHRIPHAEGGPTCEDNLAPLCRHDHRLKHQGWTYVRLASSAKTSQPGTRRGPADRYYQWTSRLSHTYLTGGPSP